MKYIINIKTAERRKTVIFGLKLNIFRVPSLICIDVRAPKTPKVAANIIIDTVLAVVDLNLNIRGNSIER